ncbi:protein kinase domain-containing protein [Georgenia faecalis]|uniref:non-specific serine/threonine protein kinase n=1 Tax=Georgenia faecalis TaxID=2483799 RepID=A0ABV9DD76_9MICO|nr:protein kinase [Georgenia faecalis]
MVGRRTRSPGGPEVPGHRLGAPVGFGANGAVWSARDAAGRDVVVSVLPLAPGEAGAAQLRRLAALRGLAHPHLARVVDVVGLDQRRCALVSERVPGPTLATVRAAGGGASPGELATLLASLADALASLHDRGVVHGDVSPANVVIAPGGVPVLVDLAGEVAHELGTPGFIAPERARGQAAGAPGDVWALARLVLWAGPDEPDPGVAALVAAALDPDPPRRPTARALANRSPAVAAKGVRVPSAPELAQARLRATDSPTRVRPPTRREVRERAAVRQARPTRRARRPWSLALAAVAVGTALVVAGMQVAGQGPAGRAVGEPRGPVPGATGPAATTPGMTAEPASPTTGAPSPGPGASPGPAPGAFDARAVVGSLLDRRDAALMAGDREGLAALSVPGGPAAAGDEELVGRIASSATTIRDLRTEVVEVRTVEESARGAVLEAVLRQQAHRRVVDGEVVDVPAQPARCLRLTLAGPPWRLADATPCR